MPSNPPEPSSLSSLVASRRRRRGDNPEPAARPGAATGVLARLARTGPNVLEGHLFDAGDPDRRFVVELVLNGLAVSLARAELFDPALLAAGGGDGCHGFCFHLDPAMVPALQSACVRVANTGALVGGPVDFATEPAFAPPAGPPGEAEWSGGLRIAGWVRRDVAPFPAVIEAFANGARVAFTRANLWRTVERGGNRTAEPGFTLTLPRDLADGRAKEIDVLCDGRPLSGSPMRLVAFPDGLHAHLTELAETEAEAERGRWFDAAFPDTVPFASLPEWERRFPSSVPERASAGTLGVVVVGARGAEATLGAPALDGLADWVGTILPPGDAPDRFSPADLLLFLAGEPDCETVLFVAAGATIRPHLPARLAAALLADRAAAIAYGDVLLDCGDGEVVPLALPAFDYERALEQGIGSRCFAMRRGAAIAAAERGVSDLTRLFLSPIESQALSGGTHLHVPGFGTVLPSTSGDAEAMARSVGEHLEARGRAALVTPRSGPGTLPAVRVRRPVSPRSLSLVILADDDPTRVAPALAALEETRGRKEARIVVGASNVDEALKTRLELAGIALVEPPAHLSAARQVAAAIEAAQTELVCVLDARLRPAAPDWLDELLSRFAEDDVGIVAPLVVGPGGLLAQAGLVLSPTGRPVPLFADRRHGDPGYGDALLTARQAVAVGSSCFLTRRGDFLALDGFDPLLFPAYHGSVDYCLKLQALGRRIVVTPDAVLVRSEEADGDRPELPRETAAREREERILLSRWPVVCANDPFASPLLNRGAPAFSGLAWPPGDRAPRRSGVAPARPVPPGW